MPTGSGDPSAARVTSTAVRPASRNARISVSDIAMSARWSATCVTLGWARIPGTTTALPRDADGEGAT